MSVVLSFSLSLCVYIMNFKLLLFSLQKMEKWHEEKFFAEISFLQMPFNGLEKCKNPAKETRALSRRK